MVPPYNPNDFNNPPIPPTNQYGMPIEKKKRKVWLWVLLAVLIPVMLCGIGIGGCTYWALSSTRPAFDATNDFYKAYTKGQSIDDYICQNRVPEQIEYELDTLGEEYGKISKYDMTGYNNDNGEVSISGVIYRKDGSTTLENEVTVELSKEDGKYKICRIVEKTEISNR